MLRSFIAIELPEEAKNLLAETEAALKKSGADIRWVKPGNIHLTLKFLGDTREEDVDAILMRIIGACDGFSAFKLNMAGIGLFPGPGAPKVLWMGLNGEKSLVMLQKKVEEAVAPLGFPPEKRAFTPHLTIGRFRSMENKDALIKEAVSMKDKMFGSFDVKSVIFMKSELNPSGAVYTKLGEVFLK
ncbi:MAG: RNA 2',3'-cyclic phosphodiesterase [Nitrospirae bacterium]|nr:RNA 2',3'-cyclic phosphodiesterase [Nitrospirota bacterium]